LLLQRVPEAGTFDDVTHRYVTEGTPANISHAASHSDLSVLSFRSGKDEVQGEDTVRTRTTTELSDDLFNVSDNEGMLAELIQAGMPKVRLQPKCRFDLKRFGFINVTHLFTEKLG